MEHSKSFRRFVFTVFSFNNEPELYIKRLYNTEKYNYIIAQLERCPKTSKLHIQGYAELHRKTRFNAIKSNFNDPTVHIEKAIARYDKNQSYCSKSESKVSGPYEYGKPKQQGARNDLYPMYQMIKDGSPLCDIIDQYPNQYLKYGNRIKEMCQMYQQNHHKNQLKNKFINVKLNPWQLKAESLLMEQTDRQILWVYDPIGNQGKSFLSNYLHITKDAFIGTIEKKSDIAYRYNSESLVCIDIPREQDDYLSYNFIEQIKNGIVISTKYQCSTKYVSNAKVIIFSNALPDATKWTSDRYQIYTISNGDLIKYVADDTCQIFKPVSNKSYQKELSTDYDWTSSYNN